MKLYKTTITPRSNFATPLKGDTLFGQMCWAIRYKYGNERLNTLLSIYNKEPFLVVSDGFASGYLPKPSLPSSLLNENCNEKKKNRKKRWLTIEQLKTGKFNEAITDEKANNHDMLASIVRNAINYKTSTTGDGFDPYSQEEFFLSPKDIYFLINSDFSLEELRGSFEFVSHMGYGKKATIGKGRFDISDFLEVPLPAPSKTFMTLSPFSPQSTTCKEIYYDPFTRFGKHGGDKANMHSFKKPLLLADSGAVLNFNEKQNIYFFGAAIENISLDKKTVHQGYSIVLPIKELV